MLSWHDPLLSAFAGFVGSAWVGGFVAWLPPPPPWPFLLVRILLGPEGWWRGFLHLEEGSLHALVASRSFNHVVLLLLMMLPSHFSQSGLEVQFFPRTRFDSF